MARWLDARAADFASGFAALLSMKRETDDDVSAVVRAIIAEVRARGDAALIEYSERFDKVRLTKDTLRLSPQDISAAEARCGRQALAALGVGKPEVRELGEKMLSKGPESISGQEKILILSDADVMSWLHRQAWIRPGDALAGWWQTAIRRYAR